MRDAPSVTYAWEKGLVHYFHTLPKNLFSFSVNSFSKNTFTVTEERKVQRKLISDDNVANKKCLAVVVHVMSGNAAPHNTRVMQSSIAQLDRKLC